MIYLQSKDVAVSTYLYTTKSKVLSLWPNAVTPDLQIVYYSRSTIIIEAALSLSKVVGTTASLHNVLYYIMVVMGRTDCHHSICSNSLLPLLRCSPYSATGLSCLHHTMGSKSLQIFKCASPCDFTRFFFLFDNLYMYQEVRQRTVRNKSMGIKYDFLK